MFEFLYKQINFSHCREYFGDTLKDTSVHSHDFYEIIFFLGGEVTYTAGGRTFHLKGGDVVFTPAKERHIVEIDNSSPNEMYKLAFHASILPAFLTEKLKGLKAFIKNRKELFSMFSELDLYENNSDKEELYCIYVCQLIKIMIFLFKNKENLVQANSELIRSVLEYIEENLSSCITAESISFYLGFSKSYISNQFRKEMGEPLMTYVRKKKVFAAHKMLLTGKKKPEVAESLGYKDYSTFYRAYTKIMGFKPV